MSLTLHACDRHDTKQRLAFNQLAQEIFGISFEQWYREGYWTDDYQPYGLVCEDALAASASVYQMTIQMDEKRYRVWQIGAVMSAPCFRGQGWMKALMEAIVSLGQERCDGMFLFANREVLSFYPKFGFERVKQYGYEMPWCYPAGSGCVLDMRCAWDRECLKTHYERGNPFACLQVVDAFALLMFYGISDPGDHFFWSSCCDAVVIGDVDGSCFDVYEIFGGHGHTLQEVVASVIPFAVSSLRIRFVPRDTSGMRTVWMDDDDDALFVLSNGKMPLGNGFMISPFFHT